MLVILLTRESMVKARSLQDATKRSNCLKQSEGRVISAMLLVQKICQKYVCILPGPIATYITHCANLENISSPSSGCGPSLYSSKAIFTVNKWCFRTGGDKRPWIIALKMLPVTLGSRGESCIFKYFVPQSQFFTCLRNHIISSCQCKNC